MNSSASTRPTSTKETPLDEKTVNLNNIEVDSSPTVQNTEKLLQGLNDSQSKAVSQVDGPLLVFAGAGSGKTRVLTRRIANLIRNHGVEPGEILAVTFTNKAAAEMQSRVRALVRQNTGRMWVATFHSACLRILREHAEDLGFTKQFVVYDSSDSRAVMKRVFKRLKIDPKIIEPKTVLSFIDKAKNNYLDAEDLRSASIVPDSMSELVADLYQAYQEELLACNAMDFGDLLCNALSLLKLDKVILNKFRRKFRYILVDEYQDTNDVQYQLINLLAAEHKNLCVVGDDDQSIYAFRGATITNILNFSRDYPDAVVVTLDTNYRSTENILKIANRVISANEGRQEKTMVTGNEPGEKVSCIKSYDDQEEAEFVVREITSLIAAGNSYSDIAVFYRTNAQSRAIEEALFESGTPYEIFGSHKFYERKEIKDILSYLKLLINKKDNESFLRIINTPARGIGATSVGKLTAWAEQQGLSHLEALEKLATENYGDKKPSFLAAALEKKLAGFFALYKSLETKKTKAEKTLALSDPDTSSGSANYEAIAELIRAIAEESKYLAKLRSEETPEAESRIENIQELMRVAADFVSKNSLDNGVMPKVEDFLDRTSLATDMDKNLEKQGSEESNQGNVSLMTLHLAKGLEFNNVFLVGLEEGLLPHSRSLESKEDLEEERRLLYVGITRAKKRLYITRTTNRTTFGRNSWYAGMPSRFIEDIPESLTEDHGSGFFENYY